MSARPSLISRLALLMRRPNDTDSEAGKAHLRNRAIALTALASAFARGGSMFIALFSVPMTLHYLGVERYGMWMALSALSILLNFTDFGIANSVLTAIARRAGQDGDVGTRIQISSAYGAMVSISVILFLICTLVHQFIGWADVFNVKSQLAREEAGPAALTFLVILALSTPLGLILRVQLALQEGFRASLWQCAGSVATLVALILAIRAEASLPILVVALAGTPLLILLLNALDFFIRVRAELRPSLRYFDVSVIRQLSIDGGMFLILQICTALMFGINALIVARLIGPEAAALYSVPERMFSVITTVLAFFWGPLWPAYAEAAGRGDIGWIRRTLRRSLLIGVGGASAAAFALVVAGPQLLHLWVGGAVQASFLMLLGLGVLRVLEVAGSTMAIFLNGINEVRVQVVFSVINVIISLVARIYLGFEYGVEGVIFGAILSYGLIFVVPVILVSIKAMRSFEKKQMLRMGMR